MAITSWASLGGGQLTTKEQREKLKNDPDAGRGFYKASEDDIKVCEVLEDLANKKNATLQDIVSPSRPRLQPTRTDTRTRLWHICFTSQPMSSRSSVYRPSSTSS